MIRLKENKINEKFTLEEFMSFCKDNLYNELDCKKNNIPAENKHSEMSYDEAITYWKKEIIKATRLYEDQEGNLHFHSKETYINILEILLKLLDNYKEEINYIKGKVIIELVTSPKYFTAICWNEEYELADTIPNYCLDHIKELYNKK